ncbi:MAG: ATP synthase F1 subunit epsilon [bacterium]|nr:ATP synthase F1 subunit epsilon [bacterium]
MKINFKIITPERVVLQQEVEQITVPTAMGEITILPGHIPLVAVLKAGEIILKSENKETSMAVSGGLIEVKKNETVILADTAEMASELNEEKVEEARKKAEQLLIEAKNRQEVDTAGLVGGLDRELARLKVVRKHKTRKSY